MTNWPMEIRKGLVGAGVIIAVLSLSVTAKACYDGNVRDRALRDVEYKAATKLATEYKRQVDSLTHQLDQRVAAFEALDSAYETKAVKWRTRTVYDTTPGLPVFIRQADAIPTPTVEDMREIVRSADVTINACRETVLTCQQLQAQKDSLIDAKDRMIATMPKPTPAWKRWGERVVIATLAFKLGRM